MPVATDVDYVYFFSLWCILQEVLELHSSPLHFQRHKFSGPPLSFGSSETAWLCYLDYIGWTGEGADGVFVYVCLCRSLS